MYQGNGHNPMLRKVKSLNAELVVTKLGVDVEKEWNGQKK